MGSALIEIAGVEATLGVAAVDGLVTLLLRNRRGAASLVLGATKGRWRPDAGGAAAGAGDCSKCGGDCK